jgi:hypothetical protein
MLRTYLLEVEGWSQPQPILATDLENARWVVACAFLLQAHRWTLTLVS